MDITIDNPQRNNFAPVVPRREINIILPTHYTDGRGKFRGIISTKKDHKRKNNKKDF
jgi:hypothetical protein